MKFSIITVVLNRVGSIERAVRSLQGQDYSNIEHIVLDGGSTDGTLEKLKTLLPKEAILLSEPDRGLYDAINKGLRLATGEVIGLLHSDDYYNSNQVLSEVARVFLNSSVDSVFGDAVFFSNGDPNRIIRHYSSSNFNPSRLEWGWMPAHTTLFMRREKQMVIGEYNLEYKIASDFDFICRAFTLNQTTYSYLPKVLVRMQTGGASSAGWKNTWHLNREIMSACRRNNVKTNWLKILSRYPLKLLDYM